MIYKRITLKIKQQEPHLQLGLCGFWGFGVLGFWGYWPLKVVIKYLIFIINIDGVMLNKGNAKFQWKLNKYTS